MFASVKMKRGAGGPGYRTKRIQERILKKDTQTDTGIKGYSKGY